MSVVARTGREISHYEVHELLGSGGMGEVYRATDLRLGRRVALKFLRPEADAATRQRMIHEARAASLLDHPNICTIFEVDETPQGEVFIAMAYYEGQTLDRLLAREPLPVGRALSIAIQTGRGLAAAHEELIVHLDVKPANLMIARGETVKILDFGVARRMGDTTATDDTSLAGTFAYMSPEQLRGDPVDQRADIWSLGAVLWEMLAGRPPFGAERLASVVAAILEEGSERGVAVPVGTPEVLAPILERALAKNVRRRYERVEEMVHDLIQAQASLDADAVVRLSPASAARSSIAVLPFVDMTAAQDQGYLCDGIAEEILRALTRIPDLYVASRTSAFQYRRNAADIREIGARLNVDTVLEGSVRRVGDRVRISAQLINVKDGYRLWNERYDRSIGDLFAVEDEIADQIARALKVTLASRAPAARTGGARPDAAEYDLYLQGREFFHQLRRKGFENALQIFSQAIEINPGYARAYAGIADCHSFLRLYFGRGEEALTAAGDASAKALALDPDLPDAHVSRGLALFLLDEFDEAERHLLRAIELDPRRYDPHYVFGRLRFAQGRIDEAATHFSEACAIVPEAYASWYLLGMCYRRLGQDGKARRAALECIEAVKRRVRSHPDDTRAWTMGAAVLAELGEPERAAKWVARALAVDAEEPIIEYNAACVYVRLGRFDEALRCLEASLGQGGLSRDWARNDPDLDPLRDDARFRAVMDRVAD
ncbi:MAG TPA: protein kinase [Candidatus Eisenbacteria bacterium]|nr:protein kinase [Candidatus Eisenbacteria bacterium]